MKKNPNNQFSEDEGAVKNNTPIPITKARVETVNPSDNGGRHTAFVREYGSNTPKLATVLSPSYGDVTVPEEGSDVAVLHGAKDKPWIIGHWYAIDRVENEDIKLPEYEEGDRIVSNGTNMQLRIEKKGPRISLGNHHNHPIPSLPRVEIEEQDIDVFADRNISISALNNNVDIFADSSVSISTRNEGGIEISTGDGTPVRTTSDHAMLGKLTEQSISAGTSARVEYDDERYDHGSIADENAHEMTVKHDGIYRVTGRIRVRVPSQTEVNFRLYVNGGQRRVTHRNAVSSELNTVQMTTNVPLSAGDTLHFEVFNDGSGTLNIVDSVIGAEFSVDYVSPPEKI